MSRIERVSEPRDVANPKLRGLYILDPEVFPKVYGPDQRSQITALIDVPDEPFSAEEILRHPALLSSVDVILSGWGAPCLDEALLRRMPKLQAVFYGAGSVRSFMTEAAWNRNLTVSSAYAANAVPVAEYVLATILLSLKRFWHFAANIKQEGRYPLKEDPPGAYGSTVGLVSLGAIGRLVRERLLPVGVRVVAYDPFVSAAEAAHLGLEIVSLDELFRLSDVVSLHTPSLPETRHMINASHITAMKRGATLINTSRGSVIHEAGMIEVLKRRPDLFTVLDVTDPEPPEPGSPLYHLPNVLLTPHIAGAHGGELRRLGEFMVADLCRYVRGEPLRWAVNRAQAQHRA